MNLSLPLWLSCVWNHCVFNRKFIFYTTGGLIQKWNNYNEIYNVFNVSTSGIKNRFCTLLFLFPHCFCFSNFFPLHLFFFHLKRIKKQLEWHHQKWLFVIIIIIIIKCSILTFDVTIRLHSTLSHARQLLHFSYIYIIVIIIPFNFAVLPHPLKYS